MTGLGFWYLRKETELWLTVVVDSCVA